MSEEPSPAGSRGHLGGLTGATPALSIAPSGSPTTTSSDRLIGIVNSWSETCPGHFHLRTLAEWVKEGVRAAGGMPVEFNTVAPCDGIAQGRACTTSCPCATSSPPRWS